MEVKHVSREAFNALPALGRTRAEDFILFSSLSYSI